MAMYIKIGHLWGHFYERNNSINFTIVHENRSSSEVRHIASQYTGFNTQISFELIRHFYCHMFLGVFAK